jgi:hypothetical protein
MIQNKGKKCSVSGCDNDAFCKGYCSRHYQQMRYTGKIQEKSYMAVSGFCKNLGCGKPVFVKGLCQACYMRSRQHEVKNGIQ